MNFKADLHNRKEKVAYGISVIGHPLITISVFILVYGYLFYDVKTTLSAFALIFLIVIIPVSVNNYWQAKKGFITNFDVSDRKQRASLFPYLLVLVAIMWFVMGMRHHFADKF